MRKLGVLIFAFGMAGCGGGGGGSSGVAITYPLPGGSGFSIPAGDCVIVNAQPQRLPFSTVDYSLSAGFADDNFEVGVVPSNFTCQFDPNQAFIDDVFTGSVSDSGQVPAGTYDLDIICQNLIADCLVSSISWSATY